MLGSVMGGAVSEGVIRKLHKEPHGPPEGLTHAEQTQLAKHKKDTRHNKQNKNEEHDNKGKHHNKGKHDEGEGAENLEDHSSI